MAYNAIGLVTSQTDPSGNVTTTLYDALDRVTAVTTALGTSHDDVRCRGQHDGND